MCAPRGVRVHVAVRRRPLMLHAQCHTVPVRARLCREGNQYLHWFCKHHDLPINECGKLVVAQSPDVVPGLELLYHRGRGNGVELEMVTEEQALKIEPLARTHKAALWSPTTASAGEARSRRCATAPHVAFADARVHDVSP